MRVRLLHANAGWALGCNKCRSPLRTRGHTASRVRRTGLRSTAMSEAKVDHELLVPDGGFWPAPEIPRPNIYPMEWRVETEKLAAIYQKDRKSTRLNSSHVRISYAVFC